ncbi:hypothetical protein DdX_03134 [Ditylenchus destructor]|uniref:Uncharacterized protein n=1 Tax=Ditylenchus destructor TaxID=166010 RepID=A0AAD4NCG9_9BILA|nr:hypothetical protein DdX_03134 [Ditylenchus destructor]
MDWFANFSFWLILEHLGTYDNLICRLMSQRMGVSEFVLSAVASPLAKLFSTSGEDAGDSRADDSSRRRPAHIPLTAHGPSIHATPNRWGRMSDSDQRREQESGGGEAGESLEAAAALIID